MHARIEPGVHSQQWTRWNWVLRERNEPSPCLPPHSGCICYITCCYTKLKDLCVGSSVWDDALNIYSFIYWTSSKQCEPASGQDSDSKKMLWTESSAIGISFSPPWAAVSHTTFSSRFLRSSQRVSTHGQRSCFLGSSTKESLMLWFQVLLSSLIKRSFMQMIRLFT